MSEKLIVKNFGPIQEVELDLKQALVFIGPQSSGKSTIAKLISIFRELKFVYFKNSFSELLKEYNILSFLNSKSYIEFTSKYYNFKYLNEKEILDFEEENNLQKLRKEYNEYFDSKKIRDKSNYRLELIAERDTSEAALQVMLESAEKNKYLKEIEDLKEKINKAKKELTLLEHNDQIAQKIFQYTNYSQYIPAERIFIVTAVGSFVNLINNNVPISKYILEFGAEFEKARANINDLRIDFLNINYKFLNNEDRIYVNDEVFIKFNESASGIQTALPILIVIKNSNKVFWAGTTFVIEEPELSLFPKAQKKLLEFLVETCTSTSKEKNICNELVITTHSPYVLTALNNLLLASKIIEKDPSKKKDVSKIINENYWLYFEKFNAYYFENGAARRIMNDKTGLISENELDSASEEINEEFSELMEIYK